MIASNIIASNICEFKRIYVINQIACIYNASVACYKTLFVLSGQLPKLTLSGETQHNGSIPHSWFATLTSQCILFSLTKHDLNNFSYKISAEHS